MRESPTTVKPGIDKGWLAAKGDDSPIVHRLPAAIGG